MALGKVKLENFAFHLTLRSFFSIFTRIRNPLKKKKPRMKRFVYLFLLLIVGSCGSRSDSRLDWSEAADPLAVSPEIWNAVTVADASFGSTDIRYPRSEPFAGTISEQQTLVGWKGEKVHAQIVVWTPAEIRNLSCTIAPFQGEQGVMEGIAQARFVKYVLSDDFNPKDPCGARLPGEPSHLEPDLLDPAAKLTVPVQTTRPVWITVEIPADAAPGFYTAPVQLKGKNFSKQLTLGLEVIDRTLPDPSQWVYHLDLWQHPASVARVEGVPVWSDEHFRRMEPTMKLLADAGQKVITATLNKDPWNNQCYDPYDDMIVWTKNPDGSWEYDFQVFDRWVEFMMDLGVRKMINCYSMIPWNNMLHYYDAETGEFVDVKADPGTPVFREMWTPFLLAFTDHLHEKGWLSITNIAMDERSPEHMAEATALLAEVAPELGIALADNHKIFKKYPYIKDMCAAIFGPIDPEDIRLRRENGLNTTFYVCCSSEFPNTFTSSDPAEAVYYAWYAAAHDYDGFLRWAYNSWTEDPIRDARFRTWASGDTYIVYPEGRSSIRFERLVEGIQDWEKMRLLREQFAGDSLQIARLDQLVAPFAVRLRTDGWNERLNEAKQLLNEM